MTPNEKNLQCRMYLPDLHIDLYLYQEKGSIYYECFFEKKILFSGNDIRPSKAYEPFSIPCALEVLSFLALKPGDTDKEHFNNYTPEQLVWCQTLQREMLNLYILNYEGGSQPKKEEASAYFHQHFTRYRHPHTIFSLNDMTQRQEGTIYLTYQQRVGLKSLLLKHKPSEATTKKILDALADDFRKLKKDPRLEAILFDGEKLTFKPNRDSKKELTALIKHITKDY